MSIAVAADIKNWPNADNMNPINWIIEAAILDVPLKQSSPTNVTESWNGSVWAPAYHYVRLNKERLLSDVYLKFSWVFVPVSGNSGDENFQPWATKGVVWPFIITFQSLRKHRTEMFFTDTFIMNNIPVKPNT